MLPMALQTISCLPFDQPIPQSPTLLILRDFFNHLGPVYGFDCYIMFFVNLKLKVQVHMIYGIILIVQGILCVVWLVPQ